MNGNNWLNLERPCHGREVSYGSALARPQRTRTDEEGDKGEVNMEDTLPEIEIVNFWYMFIFCGHRLDILLVMIKICTNRTNHHSSLSIAAGKQ